MDIMFYFNAHISTNLQYYGEDIYFSRTFVSSLKLENVEIIVCYEYSLKYMIYIFFDRSNKPLTNILLPGCYEKLLINTHIMQ